MKFPAPFRTLLAKTMAWLSLHLMVLAALFWVFVSWQLGLGLDSLLSGSAGERIASFATDVRDALSRLPESDWQESIRQQLAQRGMQGWLVTGRNLRSIAKPFPDNVAQRVRDSLPPGPMGRQGGGMPPGRSGGPEEIRRGFPGGPPGGEMATDSPPAADGAAPRPRPVFLLRGDGGDGYWAGVVLPLQHGPSQPRRPALLVIRSNSLGGAGMFFDLRPWLWGGAAVLVVSLIFWLPAVWLISRYLRKLTVAAESIAEGHFQISLAPYPQDELGQLGRSVESMAIRLDQLVSGQKRFLGDAAHELCAPLARLRTGLSVTGTRIQPELHADWEALDQDAAELAELVQEILRFSRTGRQTPQRQAVELEPILRTCASRDGSTLRIGWNLPKSASVIGDPTMLTRAVSNVIRNAVRHAGEEAGLEIRVRQNADHWEILFQDDGPGVAEEDLPRLFEPFYRTDLSRSRETGGFGLGLAIVRVSIQACGGTAEAAKSPLGGLSVILRLPAVQTFSEPPQ